MSDIDDIAALRVELAERDRRIAELEAELAKERASHEHCRYWYAVRIERITDLAKEHGVWREVATIIANGTAHDDEPPTYAAMLNRERHKVQRLTLERDEWQRQAVDAEAELERVRDVVDAATAWWEDAGSLNALTVAVDRHRKTRAGDLPGGDPKHTPFCRTSGVDHECPACNAGETRAGGDAVPPPTTDAEIDALPRFEMPSAYDRCCGKCPGGTCYVDQETGA